MQVARIIQAVVNSVPANADVHVEINPNPRNFGQQPHIEIQHVPSQQQPPTTGASNTGSPTEQGTFFFEISIHSLSPRWRLKETDKSSFPHQFRKQSTAGDHGNPSNNINTNSINGPTTSSCYWNTGWTDSQLASRADATFIIRSVIRFNIRFSVLND